MKWVVTMNEPGPIDAVFQAVRDSNLGQLLAGVGSLPDGANSVNRKGRSLLAEAIVARNKPVLLVLLQRGAVVSGPAEANGSPHLHFAIDTGASGSGGIEVVELLIQNGADVHAAGVAGDSALHRAAEAGPMSLYSAYMTRYLLGAGADVGATNDRGKTALHVTVTTVAKETVKILCRHGASPDVLDANGKTPLQYATETWANDDEYRYLTQEYAALLQGVRQSF